MQFNKIIPVLFFALTLPIGLSAQTVRPQAPASAKQYPSFLTIDDYPDGSKYLPAPPDTSSIQYLYDFACYQWGKSLRSTERGRLAAADADMEDEALLRDFAEAFGLPLSPKTTPEIFRLVQLMNSDAGLATWKAKRYYRRKRPYVQFSEPTSVPHDEARHRRSGSYPSGHSSTGWAVALVLAEINVAQQEAILRRGYELGESRVIAGYHYQSDVDAGRLAGAACVARLHADKAFAKQLERAKKEFQKLEVRND
jgi:acid phosphatase (class A)